MTAGTGPADVAAARLLLARMGLTVGDLLDSDAASSAAPTFAEYVPVVAASVNLGTRRVYGSYWDRIVEHGAPAAWTSPPPRRSGT